MGCSYIQKQSTNNIVHISFLHLRTTLRTLPLSFKILFSRSTRFVALSINSSFCYYPLAPPLPFPQSRENALKQRFFPPSYLKTAGEVPYTPPRGEINPCVGPSAAPPSRFLQLTPPDEPDRSAPPGHAFRRNQPTSPSAVMAEHFSRGKHVHLQEAKTNI